MKKLISLLIFLLFTLLGMWWYYSCDWCLGGENKGSSIVEDKTDPNAETLAKKAYEDSLALAQGLFAINNQGDDIFRYPENLRINNTNGNVYIPDEISDFGNSISNFLSKNQDQELVIYGYETSSEKDQESGFGLLRANFIKNVLIQAGINGDRIVTKAKLHDYAYDTNGNYKGGILLNFDIIDESRLKEVEEGIANKTLYAAFGAKDFTPDPTLANYTLELKNYLAKYPDKNVLIIGHTDNVGTPESNYLFGNKRATNVKEYLQSQGIPSSRLKASSKGETSPVAPNDTEENRAKNRRIEIIVN